jgi:LysR family transcriptional regulator, glycine cleavage system transcriptional activator
MVIMSIAPPRPKGPPLNALRAFEAAARLNSFSRAADELCVTPGAVAQHIKVLEEWAGAPLFDRHAQGVRLTSLGRAVAPGLGTAFDSLADAAHLLRRIAAPDEIRIAALPSVAQLWLSPRLPAIRRTSPGLSISVTAMERPPNLMREPFDLAIFFSTGQAKDAGMQILAEDSLFPVCAPDIAKRLTTPRDLSAETLLHDANWRDDWAIWLAAEKLSGITTALGPAYSLYSLAVEEAIHGAGVLIGHAPLVAPALASGALVAPFARRTAAPMPLIATLRESSPENLLLRNLALRLAEQKAEHPI